MGVQGLWQLLETTGRPVTLESLEGKVLAVDVSIWLHQAIHGMRDDQGNVTPNAHLLVLFHRICKLLFYRIKPVFVFDGGVPQLKKQTLVARRQRREMAASKSKRTADKMLNNYMRSHALQAVLSGKKQSKGPPVPKLSKISTSQDEPDMFQLPPLPESSQDSQDSQLSDTWEEREDDLADYTSYLEDAEKVDIDSDVFKALPLEIQHELITEMRERGKRSSWKKIKELPKKADDFSQYQISKLLGKGKMTQRLDKLRKEMTVQNTGSIASMLDYETSIDELHAGRIMSEDTEHYVLLKSKPKNQTEVDNEGALEPSTSGATTQVVGMNEKIKDDTRETVVEVKGQSTSKTSSDTGTITEETPISLDKSQAISDAVKSFFSDDSASQSKQLQKSSDVAESQSQRSFTESKDQGTTSVIKRVNSDTKDSDIVILSSDDDDNNEGSVVSPSPSGDDIEIIGEKREPPKKSLPMFFMSVMDKLVTSALKEQNEPEHSNTSRVVDMKTLLQSPGSGPTYIPVTDAPSLLSGTPARNADTASGSQGTTDTKPSPAMADEDDIQVVCEVEASADTTKKQGATVRDKKSKDVQITDVTSTETTSKDRQNPDASMNSPDVADASFMKPTQHMGPMISAVFHKLVASALSSEQTGEPGGQLKSGVVINLPGPPVGMQQKAGVDGDVAAEKKVTTIEDSDEESDEDDFVDVPISSDNDDSNTPQEARLTTHAMSRSSSQPIESSEDTSPVNPTDKEARDIEMETVDRDKSDSEMNEDENESDAASDESDAAMETGDHDKQEEVYLPDASEEWAGMDVEDTSALQDELESERLVLTMERGKQDRVARSITDVMYQESKDLIRLFGLPFIDSPQEAEAQCAFLDLTDQTNGTITDDSDIWLFGGRYVFKNFFTKGKDVEFFRNADFDKQLVLDREKLILLAYLLGSDYTEGIQGVGWVTAMEVLSEFPGEKLEGLNKLRIWWEKAQKQLMPPVESIIKGKLRKVTIHPGFPNPHVMEAYLNPPIDESQEEFSWGSPDLDLLRDFAAEKFGWNRAKVDEALLPVIKKMNEKRIQSKINQFFPMEHHQPKKIKSKRLQKVLKKLGNPNADSADDATADKTNKTRRRRPTPKPNATKDLNGIGDGDDSRVKVQGKAKRTVHTSGAAKGSDSDASDEYVPTAKVAKGVKVQIRTSRRTSKKVVELIDLKENGNGRKEKKTEEDKSSGNNLSTDGSVAGLYSKNTHGGVFKAKDVGDLRGAKGARGRGTNKGRGKGRVGVKGKGKLPAKRGQGRGVGAGVTFSGPKLSESSSDDSD